MSRKASSNFDVQAAHEHFSAECFNRTWTLIEKAQRTADELEAMVPCAMASLWHWTQRSDCTNRNLSVGHWQVSRVFALAGQGENAMRHALRSLALAEGSSPFYIAYAHEAVARAALVLNDRKLLVDHLIEARRYAAGVTNAPERQWLDQDLKPLEAAVVPTA